MSVLVEALSIVVRRDVLDRKYPGGVLRYQAECPNNSFCADLFLTRVGFMDPVDVQTWLAHLEGYALVYLRGDYVVDIATVSQQEGFLGLCTWLESGTVDGIGSVWLKGTDPGQLATPINWTPEQTRGMVYVSQDEIDHRVLKLDSKAGIDEALDLDSGRTLYSASRPPSAQTEKSITARGGREVIGRSPESTIPMSGLQHTRDSFSSELSGYEREFIQLDTAVRNEQHPDHIGIAAKLDVLVERIGMLTENTPETPQGFPTKSAAGEYQSLLTRAVMTLRDYCFGLAASPSDTDLSSRNLQAWTRARTDYYRTAIQFGRGPAERSRIQEYARIGFYPMLAAAGIIGAQASGALGALTGVVVLLLVRSALTGPRYEQITSSQFFADALRLGSYAQAATVLLGAAIVGWQWGWLGAALGHLLGIPITRGIVVLKGKARHFTP